MNRLTVAIADPTQTSSALNFGYSPLPITLLGEQALSEALNCGVRHISIANLP
jgi:hypothetical protein